MALETIFKVASTGMTAQSIRLNTTASNLANAQTVSGTAEEAYRARHPIFSTHKSFANTLHEHYAKGVRVDSITHSSLEAEARYEPGHSMANEDGYVFYPNVNTVEEMANMMSASRAFEVNAEVISTTKKLMESVLSIGR